MQTDNLIAPEDLLTAREAGDVARVRHQRISRADRDGRLVATNGAREFGTGHGGSYTRLVRLYRREDVLAWADALVRRPHIRTDEQVGAARAATRARIEARHAERVACELTSEQPEEGEAPRINRERRVKPSLLAWPPTSHIPWSRQQVATASAAHLVHRLAAAVGTPTAAAMLGVSRAHVKAIVETRRGVVDEERARRMVDRVEELANLGMDRDEPVCADDVPPPSLADLAEACR